MHSYKTYYNYFKGSAIEKICNARDFRTSRHIVIFESDDWGSLRMPSADALKRLESSGYDFFTDIGYDLYDSIATNDDLEILMSALNTVRDSNGNPAKLTMNCVVANPDFNAIKDSGYNEYKYELITETFKRAPRCDRAFPLWNEGRSKGLFQQQFHGREHLNVPMWLKLLREDVPAVRDCFDEHVWSMKLDKSIDVRQHPLAAYLIESKSEQDFVRKSISDGIDAFYSLFGFYPKSMIAPNYTWDTYIEREAQAKNIQLFQGSRYQRPSLYERNNGKGTVCHYTGEKNQFGQVYSVRNCLFEPSQNKKYNSDSCLSDIDHSFRSKKIAIVSCHRLNFVGALEKRNRDENIRDFSILLKTLVNKYPDIEFLSSDQIIEILK